METLMELWKKVVAHPDYIHAELWTTADCVEYLCDSVYDYATEQDWYDEALDNEINNLETEILEKIVYKNKNAFSEMISDYCCYSFDNSSPTDDFDYGWLNSKIETEIDVKEIKDKKGREFYVINGKRFIPKPELQLELN